MSEFSGGPNNIISPDARSLFNRIHNGTFQHWENTTDIAFWQQRSLNSNGQVLGPISTDPAKTIRSIARVGGCPGVSGSASTDGGKFIVSIELPAGLNAGFNGISDTGFDWGLVQFIKGHQKLERRTVSFSSSFSSLNPNGIAYVGILGGTGVEYSKPVNISSSDLWKRTTIVSTMATQTTHVAALIIPVNPNPYNMTIRVSAAAFAVGSYETGVPFLDDLWDIMFPPGTCILVRGNKCPEGFTPVVDLYNLNAAGGSTFKDAAGVSLQGRTLVASDDYRPEAGGAGDTLANHSHKITVPKAAATNDNTGTSIAGITNLTTDVQPQADPNIDVARDKFRPYYATILVCEKLSGQVFGQAPTSITSHETDSEWKNNT